MTNATWKTLVAAIGTLKSSPAWLQEIARLTHAEISRLPKLGNEAKGTFAAPYVTEKPLLPDYLVFLREQIQLSPRGPEWTEVLRGRLNALEPFLGKKVLTVDFYRKPDSATLWINPETGELFHVEVF